MTHSVTLSVDDYALALHIAHQRMMESLWNNRRDALFEKDWVLAHRVHLLGGIGEGALAKWLDTYPRCSVRQFHGMDSDLSGSIEVRHRANPTHDLIIRSDDPEDRIYVLTRGLPPGEIEMGGWCWGYEWKGKSLANHGDWGEATFVPSAQLHDMETIPRQ